MAQSSGSPGLRPSAIGRPPMTTPAEVIYFVNLADSEAVCTIVQDSDQPGPPGKGCCDYFEALAAEAARPKVET